MDSSDDKNTSYKYKKLNTADILLLKKLMIVFAQSFDDPETYQSKIPNDIYLQSLLDKPYFIALVALDNDQVVGGLTAYELEKPEQDRREIYIYDLAVSEKHRRHGVATKLINNLKDLARKMGVYAIYVQADKGDEAAIKLYETLGIKEDVYHFDIKIN